jgi:hypothetical protein
MLTLTSERNTMLCDGSSRRAFLKVGALAGAGLCLSDLLRARASASTANNRATRNTSVVWLYLNGGAPHIETFDPKMDAPVEFRSSTGDVQTSVPGLRIGGTFERIGRMADKMAFVRSLAHGATGHGHGAVWMHTGYRPQPFNELTLLHPTHGSILSRVRGASHPTTGMPTYISLSDRVYGPAWLGSGYAPFHAPHGIPGRNMTAILPESRMTERRQLMQAFDGIDREVDQNGLLDGLDSFEQQAFSLIRGAAREAFDVLREDRATLALYGINGPQRPRLAVNQPGYDQDNVVDIARHLLMARRLCEAGAGLVTVAGGNWDFHGQTPRMAVQAGMSRMGPVLDHAVAAFLQDIHNRGLEDNILLVITGDFGRAPRIDRNGGRGHWGALCTLALAGGGLKMGQVIGESSRRAETPKTTPITPTDVLATLFHVLGIPQDVHISDNTGRPIPMLRGGRLIRELL